MSGERLYTFDDELEPGASEPVLVVHLEGWIDAGFGGATAIGTFKSQIRTHRLVTFDTDELIDQRARRPVMRLVNGVNTSLRWPRLQIRHGRDRAGQLVLVLTGPEPDFRWQRFAADVIDIARRLRVRMVVGLGAFPAAYPHTRPVTIGSTATSSELAERIGYLPGSFEIAAGMQGALERGFAETGIPAVGLWARVPHYVANMPYPAAAAALLDTLAANTGLVIDTGDLHVAATNSRQQIDGLLASNPDHVTMVRQLEQQADAAGTGGREVQITEPSNLPSGDELAAELERFLRDQQQ